MVKELAVDLISNPGTLLSQFSKETCCVEPIEVTLNFAIQNLELTNVVRPSAVRVEHVETCRSGTGLL
jgi:hypothetical protein